MKRLFSILWLMVCLAGVPAWAGTDCRPRTIPPEQVANAASTALRVIHALDEVDAPVALIARVGTDLSAHGLVYSHAGFAVRDHALGRWTVVHLLNDCGSDRSALHAQGMVNFFADDLVNQDARIVWLRNDVAERLAGHLSRRPFHSLHEPHYNLIARPGSRNYQNSTAWVLETLAANLSPPTAASARGPAYEAARKDGFRPDTVHISYGKRLLGGLFSANTVFTDHPVATRLSGEYPVVTVRSIVRYLETRGYVAQQREWRGGRRLSRPGPV